MKKTLIPPPELLSKGIVIRAPNWLGDVIMAIPAMVSLYKMLPTEKPKLYVIVSEGLSKIFETIPFVTGIVRISDGHSSWSASKINEIKALNAGVGFLFVNSFRSAYYMSKTVSNLYGASKFPRDFFLTKSFKVKWNSKNKYTEEHQSHKYLSMVKSLGAPDWNGKYPEFNITQSDTVKALLNEVKGGKLLSIAPGAAYGPSKRWSVEKYREVCEHWIKKYDGKILLLGGGNELEASEKISAGLPAERVINAAGKTSLEELMALLKASDICVCNDSGVMHLGSALNIKGIAVFGSTDPYATGPLSKNWSVVIKKQECAPCFSRTCVNDKQDYRCLNQISSAEVINILDSFF